MNRFLIWILCLMLTGPLMGQKYTISGTVEDQTTGERLISANVYDSNSLQGVITNAYGFYSLTLPSGKVSLTFSYIGYNKVTINLNLVRDTMIHMVMKPSITLDEVIISGEKTKSAVHSSQMSMTELSANTIKGLPVFLGEVDVLKALQLLPGVQSGSEGTSGIYVRGGGPDQNLILLDGVPVYNANHLFGFFSVFNPDAIQNVKLIKGGFPAQYGGRLSSVLDIRMKEGNNKHFTAEGSVGIVASKLTVEGPVWKDHTSFIISARRTYVDALAQPLIAWQAAQNDLEKLRAGYYFYDMNAKINHRFSDKSRLYLSAYSGRDKAYMANKEKWDDNSYQTDAGLGWGNLTAALRWNYVITPKLFSNTTVTYSKYNFLTSMKEEEHEKEQLLHKYAFTYDSGIRDWAGKIDFDYLPDPHHSIKFGASHIFHSFRPGVSVFQVEEQLMDQPLDTTFGNKQINAREWAMYAQDDWLIGSRLKVNAGLHFSGFAVDDSTYWSLQPRISLRFLVNEKLSVKAAYSHMTQYIH
ncbi:MAG: TonB-dependent receptor, partial [Bacteroidales bacterium]|nr:TonB-dependent receptor [Bacteroidales bacterium]